MAQRNWGGIGGVVPKRSDIELAGIGYGENGEEPNVVWEFDSQTVERITAEPEFSLVEFDIAGPVAFDSEIETTITVKNTGDAGVFRAVMGERGSSHPYAIEQPVAADTTESITVPFRYPRMPKGTRAQSGRSRGDVDFKLVSAQGDTMTTTAPVEE